MIYPWFHITEDDKAFYNHFLKDRMPDKILDVHVHMNKLEHVKAITPQRMQEDWALECGLHMDYEASQFYYSTLFPGKTVELNAFPFPLPEVDIPANNEYLGSLADEGKINAMMSVRPEWDAETCEEMLLKHQFTGFKPYPYLASQEKGADISVFDFMPHHQIAVLNKHKKAMMLHLPRHGRLPDKDNIREILELRQKYPDMKLILAHFGRCFDANFFKKGMGALGKDLEGIYFDCAAVTNAEVFALALEMLDTKQFLFGTDEPILLWHGEQTWNEGGSAVNFTREDFSWNKHPKTPKEEEEFVFIVYRQINNLLDALGNNETAKQQIFYANAKTVLG